MLHAITKVSRRYKARLGQRGAEGVPGSRSYSGCWGCLQVVLH